MIYTLAKTTKKEPGPTEAIFFTETNYKGDAYIAYVGYEVDFGKGLKDIADSLNDILRSVKTGNLCKLVLYEDHSLEGENFTFPGNTDSPQLPLVGLTSFKAILDVDVNVKDELTQCEFDKITYENNLKECTLERKELKDKVKGLEKLLKEYRDKLDDCDKKGKALKDQLDKKNLEDEVKKVKDKLNECEKKGKELKEQLEKSEKEKNDIKTKLDECENK